VIDKDSLPLRSVQVDVRAAIGLVLLVGRHFTHTELLKEAGIERLPDLLLLLTLPLLLGEEDLRRLTAQGLEGAQEGVQRLFVVDTIREEEEVDGLLQDLRVDLAVLAPGEGGGAEGPSPIPRHPVDVNRLLQLGHHVRQVCENYLRPVAGGGDADTAEAGAQLDDPLPLEPELPLAGPPLEVLGEDERRIPHHAAHVPHRVLVEEQGLPDVGQVDFPQEDPLRHLAPTQPPPHPLTQLLLIPPEGTQRN